MKVIVESYKPTGKWYTDGEYETQKEHLFEIFDEVEAMAMQGHIPGLRIDSAWTCAPGRDDWLLRVTVPDHPHDHPHIIPLFRDYEGNRTLKHPLA